MDASIVDHHPDQPTIFVTEADYVQLERLAGSSPRPSPGAALLRAELDRAVVIEADESPWDFVRLGSLIRFTQGDSNEARTVRVVLPAAADIDRGQVSVLTPVGASLLGLRAGQRFSWLSPDGRRLSVRVLAVTAPAAAT
jgi:regulator of nucleoside diphosphate kinase